MNFGLAVWALTRREFQRFWGERSRVAGFVASPLLFWVVVGSGFGDLEYFFPGALTMTVMFSAMFSMMSLIEDRREGFLLSVLVSPAPRAAIVLGKVGGAALLAWLQGLIVLAGVFFTSLRHDAAALAGVAGALLLTALLLTVASYVVAWRLSSTQGFHAVINLLLVPAWMLSGAIFNPALSFAWVRGLMQVNPLYYSQSLVRAFLVDGGAAGAPSVGVAVAVLVGCTLLAAGAAVRGTK
ncbi:MAG: ABC transporter permease [Acidobacteria bacterium]|nr:ABC transporter permease [Acidobacteriota bacterium]